MKKLVCALLVMMFAVNILQAQSGDVLTNASIVKLIKVKVSDDIIVDMISNSTVNFSMGIDSINALLDHNVSARVIQAMQAAYHPPQQPVIKDTVTQAIIPVPEKPKVPDTQIITQPIIPKIKDTLIQPVIKDTVVTLQQPVIAAKDTLRQQEVIPTEIRSETPIQLPKEKPKPDKIKISESENQWYTINTLSYVEPVKDLMLFFDEQGKSITIFIQRWNRQINQMLEKENRLMDTIAATGRELTAKKNENAKLYNAEINNLQQRLAQFRQEHEQSKELLVEDGKNLVKEIKALDGETDKAVNDKFNSVSKNVRGVNPEPSKAQIPVALKIAKQNIDDDLSIHIMPLTVVPACFQNEIAAMLETIAAWNEKVKAVMRQDSVYKTQAEPLDNELSQYLSGTKESQKQYKKEISALKKQIGDINKQRKQLAKQMVDDSKKFSGTLDNLGNEFRAVIKQRFADAMENIEHTYKDKF